MKVKINLFYFTKIDNCIKEVKTRLSVSPNKKVNDKFEEKKIAENIYLVKDPVNFKKKESTINCKCIIF